MGKRSLMSALFAGSVMASSAAMAQAQQAAAEDTLAVPEIIVTAEKREQRINDVPLSITALTGAQLKAAGVQAARDLPRVTPGLTFADSYTGTPIYTLRGIGFVDQSIGGRPTVSLYQDEAPIPFAIESRGAFLDLERVEVLKGPQGTLFGSNSTGGLINLIAAKPTRDLEAGAEASYGRFNAWELNGYVSGPITDDVGARLALQHVDRGNWQKSYTTGAKLGQQDFTSGRFTLDLHPGDRFRMALTASGWIDKSDTQATQLIAVTPQTGSQAFIQGLLNYPLAPHNDRAADWNPNKDYGRDNWFGQINNRIDGDLSDTVKLTSISSFSRYHEDESLDPDGTRLDNAPIHTDGKIISISQELRLAAHIADRLNLTLGANYAHDKTDEIETGNPVDSVLTSLVVPFGPPLTSFSVTTFQKHTQKAVFADADFAVTPQLNLFGGVRYTDMRITFKGGVKDVGDGNAAAVFGTAYALFIPFPIPPIPPGGYVVLGPTFAPEIVRGHLNEDNVSWRGGLRWTPVEGKMLYASISRGYKAGSFPNIPSETYTSYTPAKQESLTAYEAGFKLALAGRTLQLNGAAFYYDYKDKQILGRELTSFGPLPRLVNIPKSRAQGAELQLTWAPAKGLTLNAAGTYVDTKIRGDFISNNSLGADLNFRGSRFPNAPKWQASGGADYRLDVGQNLVGVLGGNVSYQSRTNSLLGDEPLLAVKGYALVDLRAGIEAADGRWRATLWGKNIFNTYYWTTATKVSDTTVRYAGMPATYGATIAFRFR